MTQKDFVKRTIQAMDSLAVAYAENPKAIKERNIVTAESITYVDTVVGSTGVTLKIQDDPRIQNAFTIRAEVHDMKNVLKGNCQIIKGKVYTLPQSIGIIKSYIKGSGRELTNSKEPLFFDDSYDSYVDRKKETMKLLKTYIKEIVNTMYKDDLNVLDMSDDDFEKLLKCSGAMLKAQRNFAELKNKYKVNK